MIPGFNSYAASYPATTSFTYTYDGYDYHFYFSGEVDSPQDYKFDSTVCDYVIEKAAEGLNLSVSSGLGAKINWLTGIVASSVFNFCRNYMIAVDKVLADWIISTSIYGFRFEFTGEDANYPGYETYGSAYGWRFTGWLGEKIDLVLDSQGMLYGSNPIGNYTFSDDQRDFGIWSIHQHDDDDIWMPSISVGSFNDLKQPYIIGKTLYFSIYNGTTEYQLSVPDFTRSIISFRVPSNMFLYGLYLFNLDNKPTSIVINDVTYNSITDNSNPIRYSGLHGNRDISNFVMTTLNSAPFYIYPNINFPSFYGEVNNGGYRRVLSPNYLGIYNNSFVSGSGDIWLDSLTTSPLPDPIVLPVDDPIPVTDIQPDPVDFTPDPGDEPQPVPGIDYPVPDPEPIPVPPLPPLVSGNDDMWPDLNYVFNIEADLDGFLGGLSNFQFTPLRTLVDGFTSALTWVSTIMMLLYDGSDFSILFVVLSVFFIAAALLGIYKWWTR